MNSEFLIQSLEKHNKFCLVGAPLLQYCEITEVLFYTEVAIV